VISHEGLIIRGTAVRLENFKAPVHDEDRDYPVMKAQGKNFPYGYSRMKENPEKMIHKSRYKFGQDRLRENGFKKCLF
jgi:hypothetical protein